jgi:hypothetical protein
MDLSFLSIPRNSFFDLNLSQPRVIAWLASIVEITTRHGKHLHLPA